MFRILEKTMLNPTICKMVLEAPRIASAALPGQFLMVRADEPGERIPLTISDYDPVKGTVTIAIQPIGASTKKMVSLILFSESMLIPLRLSLCFYLCRLPEILADDGFM